MQKRQHLNPFNKESLPQIPTRRETIIRRRKSVPIVRNWVMTSMSAISKRLMNWHTSWNNIMFHCLTLIKIKGHLQILRAKGKHSWLVHILLRNGYLIQVPHIIWVILRKISLHWTSQRCHTSSWGIIPKWKLEEKEMWKWNLESSKMFSMFPSPFNLPNYSPQRWT